MIISFLESTFLRIIILFQFYFFISVFITSIFVIGLLYISLAYFILYALKVNCLFYLLLFLWYSNEIINAKSLLHYLANRTCSIMLTLKCFQPPVFGSATCVSFNVITLKLLLFQKLRECLYLNYLIFFLLLVFYLYLGLFPNLRSNLLLPI